MKSNVSGSNINNITTQQQSNVPVYIRGKGDSLIIGLSCGLLATGLGMSGYGIYNMIKVSFLFIE